MCGRYTLTKEEKRLTEQLRCSRAAPFTPRYNIAPTQMAPVIRINAEPELTLLRWGLIPSWVKEQEIGNKLINARAETVAEKPAFRKAFQRRRCLVLSDGFFEWAKTGAAKQPVRIILRDQQPFTFAGLWEQWRDPEGKPVETFAILTTQANALVAKIHDRMPVILKEQDYDRWLDPKAQAEHLGALLVPYPAERMEYYPVSSLINNPRFDHPDCIERMRANYFQDDQGRRLS